MFHVDPADPTPVEAQVVRTVRSAVAAGLLAPGDPLPTVRQLAVELRIDANAVGRAYDRLREQGVLEDRRGVGTVVRASPGERAREALLEELTALEDSLLRGAAALGFSLDDVIIHLDQRRSSGR